MICYTTIDTQEFGCLVFKVIGAGSRKQAQEETIKNWGTKLMAGQTVNGSVTICPLFSSLEDRFISGQKNQSCF